MSTLPLSAYRAAFRCSPVGDCLIAPDLTILDINDVFLAAVSCNRDDLIGKNFFSAFPPRSDDSSDHDASAIRESMVRVITSGKPETIAVQRYPLQVTQPNGAEGFEDRYWSCVSTPVFDLQNRLLCISHNVMDVTGLVSDKTGAEKPKAARAELARLESVWFNRAQTVQEMNKALDEERVRLRHLFDHAPGLVYFTHGAEHVIEQANDTFRALVGGRELDGKTMRDAFPELTGQGAIELLDQVYQSGKRCVNPAQRVMLKKNGGTINEWFVYYIDMVYQPIVDAEGRVTGICGQGQDITEKKHAEDDLRSREERWKLALEASGGGVWDLYLTADADSYFSNYEISYSDTWKSMLGYDYDEVGHTIDDWNDRVHSNDREQVVADLEAHIRGETKTFSSEYRMRCRNGNWIWVLSRGAVVEWDTQGHPRRIVGTSIDISYRKRSEQQVWRQANFDALTNLPNRRLFRDRLELEVRKASRSGHAIGLLFIDLDHFKEVNDLLGHDAGDQLLVEAGKRVASCVRASDTVARLGGDEFTVILTDLDRKPRVEEAACKIIDVLAVPFTLGSEVAYISGSIGITIYPNDAGEPEELIRNADQAMYGAKKEGRNRFTYFTRKMQEDAHRRLRLSGDLRNALTEGQFEVYFQPIVELESCRIVKAEALLRWHHPRLGLVEPARFIPLAEESRMINDIGDWVFREAADYSQRWSQQLHRPFEISVNKSPVQFMGQPGGMDWPRYLQNERRSSYVSIEITESILADATPDVAVTLLQYRDAGIAVALDDFGTGYSSMAYLKKFDIDYLKIDQSFIHDIERDLGSRTITKSIVVMAHELGLKAIAEGVETKRQAEFLQEVGCDFGQGFHFSKAVPAKDFEQLLLSRGPPPVPAISHH